MAQNVPDELLRDILKHALWPIPLQDYLEESETVRDEELGGPHKMPPTDVLLVCKRWLRVARPLFYNYVSISTAEQMQKLAIILRTHRGFGPMIQHLRISGGYGRDLDIVSKLTRNVKTLAMDIDLKFKDSNVGILRALPRLNPSRMYVRHARTNRSNRKVQAIDNAVQKCVSSWTSLECLYLIDFFPLSTGIAAAVREAPSLRLISMNSASFSSMVHWKQPPFEDIVANISTIHCRARETNLDGPLAYYEVPANIKDRVVFKITKSVLQHEEARRNMEAQTRASRQPVAAPTRVSSGGLGDLAEMLGIFVEDDF